MSRSFKKCLITGITGSGGSYLAEHILQKKKNIKLYGFYRSKGYLNLLKTRYKKKIIFKKLDLQKYEKLKNNLNKIKPDLIFHIASNADVRKSFDNPVEFAKNNNIITVNLLEACRKIKINPLIIICSTSEVYGNVEKKNMPITEKNNISPINPYAATKVYQDFISQIYFKSFKSRIIITRMFSYSNARRSNLFQTAFAKQIIQCERKNSNTVFHGNLNSIRTFVDIKDAMEAYWLAACKGKLGEIYNISGNKVVSVRDYLEELKENTFVKINAKIKKSLLRPQDIDLQIASCKKFKSHTGWKPNVSFKRSVKNLLNEVRELY